MPPASPPQQLVEAFTITSGWEFDNSDKLMPSLGYYGSIGSITFETSGCHGGSKCIKAEASEVTGTPTVYLAYVKQLSPGDVVTASYWGKASGNSSTGIWAHYIEDDHTDYDGSASGSSEYVGSYGEWAKTESSWTVPPRKTGLVIEARLYAADDDYHALWMDDLSVTVVSTLSPPLVATAPSYESYFTQPGSVLGVSGDNVVVEQVDRGCYSYPSCYEATEQAPGSSISAESRVSVASIHGLQPHDHVFAQAWVKGAGPGATARIWASYFQGDNVGPHDGGPGDGASESKGDRQWGCTSYAWPITAGNEGLLIQIIVEVTNSSAADSLLIDNLLISTNSTTASVVMAPQAYPPSSPPTLRDQLAKAAKASLLRDVARRIALKPAAPPPPSPSPPPPLPPHMPLSPATPSRS